MTALHVCTRCLALAVLSSAFLLSPAFAQAPDLSSMDIVEKSTPDGVVARVGDVPIDSDDFLDFYRLELLRASGGKVDALPDGARVQAAMWCVSSLIEEEIMHQDALRRNINVDSARAKVAWEEQVRQAEEILKQQNNREYTRAEVIDAMGYENESEAIADFERSIRIRSNRMEIIRERAPEISDDAVAAYYNENKDQFQRGAAIHMRRIYIQEVEGQGENPNSPNRQRAEKAMMQIMSGKKFETVAREFSDGVSRNAGGDEGVKPVEYIPDYLLAAFEDMQPGDVSDIISTPGGYHIVQLVERQSGGDVSLEEASEVIRGAIRAQEGTRIVREYCDELIANGLEVIMLLEIERNLALSDAKSLELD